MRVWIFNHLTYEFSSTFSTIHLIIFPASKVWIKGCVLQLEIEWKFLPLNIEFCFSISYHNRLNFIYYAQYAFFNKQVISARPQYITWWMLNMSHQHQPPLTTLPLTSPPPSLLYQPPPLPLPHPLLHHITLQMASNKPHQVQMMTDVVWAQVIFFFMFVFN
jgi:hypothetical protein